MQYIVPTDNECWGNEVENGYEIAKFVARLLEIYSHRQSYDDVEIDFGPYTSRGHLPIDNNREQQLIEELSLISDIGTSWQRPFTTADLAMTLGISQRQVTNLAQQFGNGKKIGRAWVFSMAEALEFFDRKTKPGPTSH
jgi:hypothetical protein